jgi:hypothetical protein
MLCPMSERYRSRDTVKQGMIKNLKCVHIQLLTIEHLIKYKALNTVHYRRMLHVLNVIYIHFRIHLCHKICFRSQEHLCMKSLPTG